VSRVQDKFGLGWGIISSATVNTEPNGYATVNMTLNNQTIPGDNNNVVAVAMPYGHFCIPDDNVHSINLNIQSTTYNAIAITQVPTLFSFWPINGMVKGEAAVYSRNYSLQANNTGLHAQLTAVEGLRGNSTATMLFGENIVKVLLDLISFLQTFVSTYNSHTHSPGPTPNPTQPFPSNLNTDQSDLQAGKGYVNDSGAPM
jgi:hypothetical protein